MNALLLLLLALLPAAPAGGGVLSFQQESDTDQQIPCLELLGYHTLVQKYRKGQDLSVEAIGEWKGKRIHDAVAACATYANVMRALHKAAVMMHTDAALRLSAPGEALAAMQQLDAASWLLMKAGPQLRPYASQWYVATARMLRERNWLGEAEQVLEWGRERLPQDAAVFYESGALEELLAADTSLPERISTSPRGLAATVDSRAHSPLDRRDVTTLKERRTGRLNSAARWLQASLGAEPSNATAHLHLGRVQTLRNDHAAARRELQQASTSSDPGIGYLARLFTGALEERLHRAEAAEQAYRDAIEWFPRGQAAYVALSATLQRAGRLDEARDVLGRMLRVDRRSGGEPWWFYFYETGDVVRARFNRLRTEARP